MIAVTLKMDFGRELSNVRVKRPRLRLDLSRMDFFGGQSWIDLRLVAFDAHVWRALFAVAARLLRHDKPLGSIPIKSYGLYGYGLYSCILFTCGQYGYGLYGYCTQ